MEKTLYFLPQAQLQFLIDALAQAGYQCIGPQVRDGAIIYDTLSQAEQLPWGIRDVQSPGGYRLEKIPQHEAFAFANGPQALKPILFKPQEILWKVQRNAQDKLEFVPTPEEEQPIAIFGARACDLAGMAIQDKVFIQAQHPDLRYKSRRDRLFVIAINCTYSSANCFCVSAGTGPEVTHSQDLLITELPEGFIISAHTDNGRNILKPLTLSFADAQQLNQAQERVKAAADMQTKRIPLDNKSGLRDLLFSSLEHPQWENVAERCLSCGNCTSVCPTCFCHSESDKPAMDRSHSTHERMWDSCFSAEHSYLNGKVLRDDTRKRYRQWLTHKVGSWFDQFDSSGCVGCGRCITWCPVGIDLTAELAAISGESNKK
ncbi:MAG TPA: 4Fe-4S dicluster domain-containing protein [Gammaproteobacteria bacterium]|nr:4Fe-4S dicluster domain-containing protein [Gammaproteobacteria bacterium]